jgi:hypothetical protein
MEVIAASILTTILIVAILNRKRTIKLKKIGFRQSTLHVIVRDILPTNQELKQKITTQSKLHMKKNTTRVIKTSDNKVYWVDNNNFLCAEIIDGEFDKDLGKPIDTSNLSKDEVNDLLYILDNLKNG